MGDKIELNEGDFFLLAACAIRYCHGRQTYMPDLIRGIVRQHIKDMEDGHLNIMIGDCEFQRDMKLYGDEKIDKPGWVKWEQELREEAKRRRDDG